MRREFIPFDEDTIRKEFGDLPESDRAKLVSLLGHYQGSGLGNPSPAKIDDYGEGLYRLRHIKPAYQGRLNYFAVDRQAGFERLMILKVYKKESQKTPASVVETALRRKQVWEEKRRKK